MNILSIGFDIPGYSEQFHDFKVQSSLHDGDLIFFCPSFYYSYSGQTYQGKTKYTETDSYHVKKTSLHWKNEILSALKSGKTIVFVLPQFDEFFVDSGKQDVNGTGRNSRIINYVEEWNNYKCIGFKDFAFTPTQGTKIKCCNPTFSEFYSQFKDLLSYKVYIDSKELKPTFTTINGEKTLGGILKAGEGFIIFLPYFDFEQKGFTKTEKGKEIWTDEAIKKGKIFVNQFIKISKTLKSEIEKTPPPDWVSSSDFVLKKELKYLSELNANSLAIQELQKKEELIKANLDEITSLKDLLFSSGKQLELAVIKALQLLGYQAQNYNDGKLELDQVITSPEGERFIGECEGKDNKDVDITKFRQLVDSLNEDFARDDVSERAIGILFGNPQRLVSPNERTLDFTEKCKSGADREKITLIKTSDLFNVAKYLSENKDLDFQRKCRNAILEQRGKVLIFPATPQKRKTATNKSIATSGAGH